MKKKILVIGPYLPGKYYGGPVKSLLNMVETLNTYYSFDIITNDRDLNANEPYSDVNIGEWNKIGSANVFYIPKGKDLHYIKRILKLNTYDLIYVSSFFARKSLIIQFLKTIKYIKIPVLVAPRGEFSSEALNLKSFKKRLLLLIYKLFRANKRNEYTCTSKKDKRDIKKILGNKININIAGNIVSDDFNKNEINKKEIGKLKLVTVSRISPIKNIDYTLNVLKKINSQKEEFEEIIFDIYGPLEDKEYWNKCLSIIEKLSDKIKVSYKGVIRYDQVVDVLSNYHLFILPSKGENFGHVIQESFLAGCPVIISDRTPWKNLKELKVGYDIPLEKEKYFIKALENFIKMDNKTFEETSKSAKKYGTYKVENQTAIKEHVLMFNKLIK